MAKNSKNRQKENRRARAKEQAARAGKRERNYRKRQRNTSIYFLLWAVFSALCLVIVVLFGAAQRVAMEQTYKGETAKNIYENGQKIHTAVLQRPPEQFNGSWSAYLNFLSSYYDTDIYILSAEGEVVFPRNPQPENGVGSGVGSNDGLGGGSNGSNGSNGGSENVSGDALDFSHKLEALKAALAAEENSAFVVYEGDGEFVYGSEISLFGESKMYLYLAKSLDLLEAAQRQMGVRTVLIAVFVFILAFAVSSAVSGWLTKPISEMREKANLLAQGDFGVDFHGSDYGEEMAELAESLNFARDELSKADSMQKELIANVSHDFKTPLTMIKAYASMIAEISGENPEKRKKHAQVIVDEADRLALLVSDVLELSKMQSGIAEMRLTSVDMSAYTQEILDKFAYLRETKGYVFVADVEEGLVAYVDELKIGQALYNLIGNAVNYTGEDKTVFVTLKKLDESKFRFSVRDTGEGIAPEEISSIWERYYRSKESHKRPVSGTGLGLSIVKTVLQKHGFIFGVESKKGEGSTFFVEFPLA